mgnify:FL=1
MVDWAVSRTCPFRETFVAEPENAYRPTTLDIKERWENFGQNLIFSHFFLKLSAPSSQLEAAVGINY